jgi:ribulose-bisphosphate carboxylase small chain
MRITQGTFSYLPDLTDEQILAQIEYCARNGWAVSVEFTDDPHPRNVYWDMWAPPLFDLTDSQPSLAQVNDCRAAHPNTYIRVSAYDRTYLRQTTALSFIVHRPKVEPGFRLERQELGDRRIQYSLHSYATDKPAGERYRENGAP